ncbi:hypothetical protein CSA56_00205 [candidate division KSB3 bacterium]|uniref:HAD family hydrolase n=1 Tax=candidate division KSB3 bacterium TaxID=2044937 RepID=A0A2G6KN62_9BACT|nr:MAG: hypothetical protein CSA56_00205 [candidate division KSB3 bacterium]
MYMTEPEHIQSQVSAPKILMVGDSLNSDILGANTAGLSSCLLLTGVTSKLMVQRLTKDSQQLPMYQFENL